MKELNDHIIYHYQNIWKKTFPHKRILKWQNDWLQNNYCKNCRYCCGKQDSNSKFFMPLLNNQLKNSEEYFYLENENTAYMDKRGCKSHSNKGCKIPREKRPIACNIFPLVLANGQLYFYKICPAILFTPLNVLLNIAQESKKFFNSFSKKDLQHISINLPERIILDRYIPANILIFK